MMHRGKNYTGNARFFGFCVDLLEIIAKQVGFDYILDLVPDNKYGAQDPDTLEWNGIVEQLIKHVSIIHNLIYTYYYEIKLMTYHLKLKTTKIIYFYLRICVQRLCWNL